MKQAVVILHGYNNHPAYTKSIETEVQKYGKFDQVLNLGVYGAYGSLLSRNYNLSSPILQVDSLGNINFDDTLVENVYYSLRRELDEEIETIHLVGHSMGGLIWRSIIKAIVKPRGDSWLWTKNSPQIGSLTQLATPNNGTEVTNLGFVRFLDKIQHTIFSKLSKWFKTIGRHIAKTFGFVSNYEENDSIELPTQMQQMEPGSNFLNWLNTGETYVDEIPHYLMIGRKNMFKITNLAWINSDQPKQIDLDDLIDMLMQYNPEYTAEKIIEEFDLTEYDEKIEMEELLHRLEGKIDIQKLKQDLNKPRYIKIFDDNYVIPNDGYVSTKDAYLEGAKIVEIDDVSHWGMILWFLPFNETEQVKIEFNNILDDIYIE